MPWRSLEPAKFSQMARGLNGHGVSVAVVGYDLCPQVSIGDIVEEMRAACLYLWRRFAKRLLVFGHSAGGHLAAALFATDWQKLGAPADLVPVATGISGVYELAPLIHTPMNEDFRLDEPMAVRLSPLYWTPPPGRVQPPQRLQRLLVYLGILVAQGVQQDVLQGTLVLLRTCADAGSIPVQPPRRASRET